jgi:hypothetical protein
MLLTSGHEIPPVDRFKSNLERRSLRTSPCATKELGHGLLVREEREAQTPGKVESAPGAPYHAAELRHERKALDISE